jgi:hypothetical protein
VEVQMALLADYAAPGADGRLDLCGVVHRLRAPRLPFVRQLMYLVLRVALGPRDPLTEKVVVKVIDPDDRPIHQFTATAAYDAVPGAERPAGFVSVLELRRLVFEKPGTHTLEVSINSRRHEQVRFDVQAQPPRNIWPLVMR